MRYLAVNWGAATDDRVAIGAIQALNEAGLDVPGGRRMGVKRHRNVRGLFLAQNFQQGLRESVQRGSV